MVRYPYCGKGLNASEIRGISHDKLLEMYRSMLRMRRIEEAIESRYHENEMKSPIHLVIGQEATAVGSAVALEKTDLIYCSHRTHGNYLAKGGDLKKMLAELYCRITGCAGSRGGSMHLIDKAAGVAGTSAICGGVVPLATGSALVSQLSKANYVVVAYFGDGAAEEGAVWESINFAALKKLPIVFFCENNFYSVCSPLHNRQPENTSLARKAEAFGAKVFTVDGANVIDVYRKSLDAVAHCRAGSGPTFIEAPVGRWRAHGGSGDDSHTGYRDPAEVKTWEVQCPIELLGNVLKAEKLLTPTQVKAMEASFKVEIEEAFRFAIESPYPTEADLYTHTYAELPAHVLEMLEKNECPG